MENGQPSKCGVRSAECGMMESQIPPHLRNEEGRTQNGECDRQRELPLTPTLAPRRGSTIGCTWLNFDLSPSPRRLRAGGGSRKCELAALENRGSG
jgi:hypothetical protein